MNSISGVMMPARAYCKLRDDLARLGAERAAALAVQAGKFHEAVLLRRARELGVFAGEIAVVHRLHFATVVFLDVAALQNPFAAQCGQAFLGRAGELRIAPRPAAIIDAHGLVRLQSHRCKTFVGVSFDFAHRHAHIGVQLALRHKRVCWRAIARCCAVRTILWLRS